MKFDFTNGEWEVRENIFVETAEIYSNEYGRVAIIDKTFPKGNKQIDANARLISCAPEILNSLIHNVNCGCYNCPDSDVIISANEKQCNGCGYFKDIKLIEKATGKTWEEINECKKKKL